MTTTDDITTKRCSQCRISFPATTEFWSAHKSGKYRLQSICKVCRKTKAADYRAANPDKVRAKSAAYRDTHRDKERARSADYRAANPDKVRAANAAYAAAHSEEKRAKNAAWRAANPEKARAREVAWYAANRDKANAASAAWRAANPGYYAAYRVANPESVKTYVRRRLARKAGLPDTFTAADWSRSLEYFDHRCAVCNRPPGLWHTLAADHWIPLSAPECHGTVISNMIPLCHGVGGCNNSKSDLNAHEWLISKFGKRKAIQIEKRIQSYFNSRAIGAITQE